MESKTIMGILSIILGIIIIACPLAGFVAIKFIVAISVILLGLYTLVNGCVDGVDWANIILGILFIIIGASLFCPVIFPLISAFICYLAGILLIVLAIVNLFTAKGVNKYFSIVAILFGIICIIFGYLFANNPLFIAVVVGVWFIVDGVMRIALPEA